MNLKEFNDWAVAKGQVANPPPNNRYLGQCVSLVQQYLYNVFNMPFKAYGNAKDWSYNVPAGFDKLDTSTQLQKGDIIVYGANYGGGYGHLGIINADGRFLDQNGVKKLAVGYRDTPFINYNCILRHQGGVDIGTQPDNGSFIVRIDKPEANVRREPNTNSTYARQPSGKNYLVNGDTFKAVALVEGENVSGNNKWFKSALGNYVWSGGVTKL